MKNEKLSLTSFSLQNATSAQHSSVLATPAGQLGLGVMAEMEDVTTTRRTPASFAAASTFSVPLIAGSRSSFCVKTKMGLAEEYLGVVDLVDNAGRGEVEHAAAAANGGEDGVVAGEIHLEEAEADRRSVQGF
ncbi:hypothetical protein CR513_59048, partial [Mucuna pruriens]